LAQSVSPDRGIWWQTASSSYRGARSSMQHDTARGKRGQLPRKWRRANDADDWRRQELEKRNCTKYHYVKFVETKKVNRKLKSCRRMILEAVEAGREKEAADLKKELKAHLSDYEYVSHYPKHLPYNALFPKEDSEASRRRREEIRKLIHTNLVREEGGEEVEDAGKDEEEEPDDFFNEEEAPKASKKKSGKAKAAEGAKVADRGQGSAQKASGKSKKLAKATAKATGKEDVEDAAPPKKKGKKGLKRKAEGEAKEAAAEPAEAPAAKKKKVIKKKKKVQA